LLEKELSFTEKPEALASGFDCMNVLFSALNVLFTRVNVLFSA